MAAVLPASVATTAPSTQPQYRRPPNSPEVKADGTVTFRDYAPNAKAVEVWGDWPVPNGGPMLRDEKGVWSATLAVPKGLWSYNFKTDGQYGVDRANPNWKTSREVTTSVLDLPGDGLWERKPGVPHGVVRLHDYESMSLHRTRHLRVYTPPDYDADPLKKYPVFYLLHGSGDNEAVWTDFGRANVILDNLIASGTTTPMIVVMTDGHAEPQPNDSISNVTAYATELIGQVIPMIDSIYRTIPGPDSRAIAGLSMGGTQSIIIGLHHPELFGWIGGMSSAVLNPERDLGDLFAHGVDADLKANHLVWFSCGTEDRFLKSNEHMDQLLTQWNVKHTYNETPGRHAWPVWRANLISLAPLLFH